MTAARTGNFYVLRLLLTRSADLRARERWRGLTALHWAAAENHPAALDTLIELGADVDERASAGWCALLYPARAGKADAVVALLKGGADVSNTIRPNRLRRRRFGRSPSRLDRRHQRPGARGDERALLAGAVSRRARRRSEPGRTGLDGAAQVGPHAAHEFRQGHAARGAARPRRPAGLRALPARQRREPERAPDRAVLQPRAEQAEPGRADAVPPRRQACGRAGDADCCSPTTVPRRSYGPPATRRR